MSERTVPGTCRSNDISLIFAFILLSIGSTLEYLLYTFITISTLVFIYSFYEIKKIAPNFKVLFNLRFNKVYIYTSFPLVLASAAEFINLKVDTIFIGSMLNEVSAGYYSAAYSIFMGATFIPLALTKVFFPNFVGLYHHNKKSAFELLNNYSLYFIIYSLVIGFIFYFLSKFIILLIFGDNFNSSIEVLQLLSFALFAIILNRLYNYDPMDPGHPRRFESLWRKEKGAIKMTASGIRELVNDTVSLINVLNPDTHTYPNPEDHEVIVFQTSANRIQPWDFGMIVPISKDINSAKAEAQRSLDSRFEL